MNTEDESRLLEIRALVVKALDVAGEVLDELSNADVVAEGGLTLASICRRLNQTIKDLTSLEKKS